MILRSLSRFSFHWVKLEFISSSFGIFHSIEKLEGKVLISSKSKLLFVIQFPEI